MLLPIKKFYITKMMLVFSIIVLKNTYFKEDLSGFLSNIAYAIRKMILRSLNNV